MVDWDEIVRCEGPAVWRAAYRLLRNRADADECFQETFLAAWEVSKRQPVRNWPAMLQRIAVSRAIDRVRKRVRRRRQEEVVDVTIVEAKTADAVQQAEAAELADALRWAIGRLPLRQAEVFWLHEFGDASHQQIAEQLGITVNSVGVILHRARQKLQELLHLRSRMYAVMKQQRSC
jgi:RNA polymerase sigma-70 factor (ECF subfamily)